MPHRRHIYATASDMANASMCTYPQSEHSLPHWKCVLRCCNDCPCINIPDEEVSNKHDETTPTIRFHIYHIIFIYHILCKRHSFAQYVQHKMVVFTRYENRTSDLVRKQIELEPFSQNPCYDVYPIFVYSHRILVSGLPRAQEPFNSSD